MTQPPEWNPEPAQWNAQSVPYPQAPFVAPQRLPIDPTVRRLWSATIVGGVLGGLFLLVGIFGSAPQQAAGGAVAAALVVVPYCMARALAELRRS